MGFPEFQWKEFDRDIWFHIPPFCTFISISRSCSDIFKVGCLTGGHPCSLDLPATRIKPNKPFWFRKYPRTFIVTENRLKCSVWVYSPRKPEQRSLGVLTIPMTLCGSSWVTTCPGVFSPGPELTFLFPGNSWKSARCVGCLSPCQCCDSICTFLCPEPSFSSHIAS